MLFSEEGKGGTPFHIAIGRCRPDMESRLRLLSSLLRILPSPRAPAPGLLAPSYRISAAQHVPEWAHTAPPDPRPTPAPAPIGPSATRHARAPGHARTSKRRLPEDALRIHYEPTGRPVLEISGEGSQTPFISFSRSDAQVWAALSWDGPVGVDTARPLEFDSGYPLQRVFTPGELIEAAMVCSSTEHEAPLLWTLKEAAVKALGRGFGELDPLHVENLDLSSSRGIVRGRIRAGKEDSPGNELSGLALRHAGNLWLGIAWM